MKHSKVTIQWRDGLHLRPAARLVQRAKSFQSSISLRVGERVADARSILAILLLCGTLGTVVDLEVSGTDEEPALAAMESLFEAEESDSSNSTEPDNHTGRPNA